MTVETHSSFLGIPALHEAVLTVPLALGRHLTGRRLTPIRVSFRHQPLGDASEHDEYFGVPVEFGAQTDEMVFSQETLDVPLLQPNNERYRRSLEHILSQVDPVAHLRCIGATVRQKLLQTLQEQVPRKTTLARSLGMSTRTLQRRLDGEGTTFENVLDQTRRDLALQHLTDPRVSSKEVTGLLGYSESGAFFRAFRRWFGCTPKEWRHKHRIT